MKELTEEEMLIYLWHKRLLGDFESALMRAIMLADTVNTAKLAQGFPMEVKAWHRFTCEDGWWNSVLAKVGKAETQAG